MEIAQLYEQCGALARSTPHTDAKAMGNAIFEWTYQVAKRSPLIRALKIARMLSHQLLVDLGTWTSIVAQRSQNKDGSEFRAHPFIQNAEKHARFVLGTVDHIFLEIAGPKSDKLRWTKLTDIAIMRVDPFRRFLYECYGFFLRQQAVDIEATYPWFVRYTDHIKRDAPSQSHIYLRVANESLHRDIPIEEIVKWHKETRPISEE